MADLLERLTAALAARYRVDREIGRGGMAHVFLAQDLKLDRPVALKVLRPDLAAALGGERFLREITLAAKLEHPHILGIHDCGEADGLLYYVMPYVEGESLRHRLSRERQLPVDHALQISREVADALSYAHSRGVIHRDIKPENILLEAGHAVVADFGIARAIDAAGGEKLTETGVALGTPQYMSPEQAGGSRDLDGRSDLYSLGCVLYEMLAGQPPFTGPTVESVVAQHLSAPTPDVTTIRPSVPSWVVAALQRSLAKTPADRFNPVAQFGEAIAPRVAVAETTALASTPAAGSAPVAAGSWRRGWRPVAAVAGVALVVAVGVWRLRPDDAAGPWSPAVALPRLVVLPFENLGAPEDEYFADGITDETVARLAKVGGLAVLARQSAMRYKGSDRTPQEIGDELGVDYLLEATISWEHASDGPDRVRVRPQLIRVADGTHVWAEMYEGDLADVFRLQSEMARRIAAALGVALLEPERRAIAARPTDDLKAYDHFLRGNHHLLQRSRESVTRAIGEYEAAVRLDSGFADAQARIAYALGLYADWGWQYPGVGTDSLLAWGFAMVDRALQLNPQSADTWMARAYLLAFRDPDTYDGVDQAFQQALTYDPNNAEAHHQYASMMVRLPGGASAEAHFHRALALEPKLAVALVNLGVLRMAEHRPVEALELFDSAVAIDPLFTHAYEHRAHARIYTGQLDRARTDAESAIEATDGVLGRSILALVAARAGDTTEARRLIAELEAEGAPLHKEGRSWVIAAYIALGAVERALDLLERERAATGLVYLRFLTRATDFDAVRDHPRFRAIRGEPGA